MNSPEKTHFGLVIFLWAAGLGAAGQFAKVSVIFPALQDIYANSGPGLGFVVSLISFLGIVLGLFAGLIVARVGFRKLLLSALFLGAALSAWQSTFPPLPLMLASRVAEGISHLVIVVAAPTLLAQISAARHRPAIMTLWSTFFGVSFAVVAWLGLPFVDVHGPASLFLAHAAFMAAVAAILFVLLPPHSAGRADAPGFGLGDIIARHIEIYRSPRKAAPALGWLFYTLTFVSLLTVLPGFVAAEHRTFLTGAMPLAGIATSMTIGVVLLRYLRAVRVVMLGFALASLVVFLVLLMPGNPWLFVTLIGVLGLVQGASFAAIPQLNPDAESQAHANGAMAQMGNLGNTIGTPILLAVLGAYGPNGMICFLFVCYGCGLLTHIIQDARRRVN